MASYEYYEIEKLEIDEIELSEEEKTSNINLLCKCRCFVEKVNKSTQTADDYFIDVDVEFMSNLENPVDIESKPRAKIFQDQFKSKDEILYESIESNIISTENLKPEIEDDEPESLHQSTDSNVDAEINVEVLNTNTSTNLESEDDDGLPPLDESIFLQQPLETNCTKIDDNNYKCNICGKHFKQIQFFLKHYQVHQEFSTLCAGCGLHSSLGTIKVHHNNFKRFGVCYIPKKKDFKEGTTMRRRFTELSDKKCKFCEKKFTKSINLFDHLNVHTKDRPYICSCGSCFGSNENFYSHLRRFKCPLEGRKIPEYSTTSVLYFMPAERSKPRKRKKPSLDMQEKPYEAQVFIKNNDLPKTINMFEGSKLECDKNLDVAKGSKPRKRKKPSPKLAKVNYKQERKYFCGYCDREFTTAPNLRVHNEREHMDRKFSCPECSRKFAKEGLLNSHINLNHIENRKCVECNLTFTSIKYKCHMRSVHKKKSSEKKLKITTNKLIDIDKDKSKYKCSICNLEYYIKLHSKHFQSQEHLNAEKIWKLQNKINRFYCRKCNADPDGYDFIGEFSKHKIVFHSWHLRRNLADFLKTFEEIKPNEECSREIEA